MSQPVSVLVDGDNVGRAHAGRILDIARCHGEPTVVRAYACTSSTGWEDVAGYRFMHSGGGKNASDFQIALDAMELLLAGGMACFVIASDDRDFTHLATRLREHGAAVIGVGTKKAPDAFRAVCRAFVDIGVPEDMQAGPPKDLDLKIKEMIARNSRKGEGMSIRDLSTKISKEHHIRIKSYPEKNWRGYLSKRPLLYDLDPRGPDAKVRFKKDGFPQSAGQTACPGAPAQPAAHPGNLRVD